MRGDTLRRAAQAGAPQAAPQGRYGQARLWTPGAGSAAVSVMVLAPGRSLVFGADGAARWVATNRLRGVVVALAPPRQAYSLGRPGANVLRFPGGGAAA